MRNHFYEKALPTQGTYCVALINPQTKRVIHRFADSHDELAKLLDKAAAQKESNVYVSPCSFEGHNRAAADAVFGRSFFIDLDVNHGKVCYTSKAEAIDALQKFVDDSGLPPPIRIDSGGGLQAYWLFEDDVPIDEWLKYAEKFKSYCMDEGLLIDPAVTADAARIMRCPGTFNLRSESYAEFLDTEVNQYDFAAFKEFLGAEPTPTSTELVVPPPTRPNGVDELTYAIAKLDNFEDSFALLAERSLAGEGCNQFRYILNNVDKLSYDQWMDALSVAHRCSDRESAIRRVSEGYPGYTPEETAFKANETGKASGPHTCATFEVNNPGGCEGCPFKGKITTPSALAKRLRTAPLPPAPEPDSGTELTEEDAWGVSTNEDLLVFPQYLEPYARGIKGGIYYTPPATVDKTGKKIQDSPFQIINCAVYPYKRMFDGEGECFMMRTVMPLDGYREFMMPAEHIYSVEFLTKALVKSGANFDPDRIKLVMKYFIRWSEYLSSIGKAEPMRKQMGWTENRESFVVGYNEITRDGSVIVAAASPLVRVVAKHLKPEGSYEVWQECVNTLNQSGFEMHAFGMMTGFGSPLISLTSVAGASICFLSANSGSAKTGSLYAAMSIWGHPKDLTVADKQATHNGFIGRYLNLKNVLFGIDEASNAKMEDLANLIHAVSHGKAKIRMQSSVNAEREHEESASLITFFTSNQSIYDKLQQLKASPDGEMARLIEFTIEKPPQMTGVMGYETFNRLKSNYGHAGIKFIQYYFKKGEPYVVELIDKWARRFIEVVGDDSAYRFYQSLIASTFAGGELANEAGIINIDLERVFQKVILEIIKLRDETVKLNKTDYPSIVTEFLYQNWAGTLQLDGPGKVTREPVAGRPLVARLETHNNVVYISSSVFKNYMYERQISTKEFTTAMRNAGLWLDVPRQRLTTGSGLKIETNPIAVIAVKIKAEELLKDDKLKRAGVDLPV